MRWWYHLVAALIGLALAAGIVFLVFGRASEQGAVPEGEAGEAAQESPAGNAEAPQPLMPAVNELCGQVSPADVLDKQRIAQARQALPAVIANGQPVGRITDAKQRAWFARIQVAGGFCVKSVALTRQFATIRAEFPEGTSEAALASYGYNLLVRAAEQPLVRQVTLLDLHVGGKRRIAYVNFGAFQKFRAARAAYDLPQDINGLRQFKRRFEYSDKELRFQGW